jgi:formylglycine-generating enzyme required for sulfatase activity
MPKCNTTIWLALISLGSFAQPSTLSIDKLKVKNVLKNLSLIPSKSFVSLSQTSNDSASFYNRKFSTNQSFYISRFEVTNKEYRDFIQYVKDSTAHFLLQHFIYGSTLIDWSQPINWEDPLLEPLMHSPDERIFGRKEINSEKIIYEFENTVHKETINTCPDSMVWIRDFDFSNNEALAKNYFSNAKYDNYPVVGINLKQAMAFCRWKTDQVNKIVSQAGTEYKVIIRLPTNTEWEAAASDDNIKGKVFSPHKVYHENFGNINDNNGFIIKTFQDDGHFYTAPVNSYSAGAYGLYNMKGNVAEWTSTSREEIINAEVKPEKQRTSFVVKGGGWNSVPFYLQTGACQFFPPDTAHSFIGFRYVVYIVKQ